MAHPPKTRSNGFGIQAGLPSQPIERRYRRALSKGTLYRKVLDVYRDGTLVFSAGKSYLCWAMKGSAMNTLTLIETVYNFFLLYREVIWDMKDEPEAIKVMARLANTQT